MTSTEHALASLPNRSLRRDRGSGPRSADQAAVRARPRVLIVEDHIDTREMYEWCMRAAGWIVEGVANGADALVAVPAFAPDVIVMDLNLPVVGGLEAILRLKRDDATRDVPIVAMTGYDRDASEADARASGCDEFVAKPCDPDALRAILERIVLSQSDR